MNIARLTYLRNIVRALGINKLLTIRKSANARKELKTYRDTRPAHADLNISGIGVRLHTVDEQEWLRARSLLSDVHIIRALLNELHPGERYWDIGASIGGYSVLMSKAVGSEGSVVAFEPEPRSWEKLKRNIDLNAANNVTALGIALGEKRETLRFVPAENASEGTHHLVSDVGNSSGGTEQIEVMPMDEFRQSHALEIPTVVKIDVEGWEEKVILGGEKTLSDPGCRAIVVEVHFAILARSNDNQAADRIMRLLRGYEFTTLSWLDTSHLLATK